MVTKGDIHILKKTQQFLSAGLFKYYDFLLPPKRANKKQALKCEGYSGK